MKVKAEDLKPYALIDLEPLWTREYAGEDNYGLYAFANSELGMVESVEVRDQMVLIYLTNGPSNAIAPLGMEFEVDGYACAECGQRALDPATDTLGGNPICQKDLDDYRAENAEPTDPKHRLEELRAALRAENISYGELADLQGLAEHIAEDDVELREAAGLPEFPEDDDRVTVTIAGRSWKVDQDVALSLESALEAAKKGGAWVTLEGDDE